MKDHSKKLSRVLTELSIRARPRYGMFEDPWDTSIEQSLRSLK